MVLVSEVIKIQNKLMYIAIETGCSNIFLSKLPSSKSLQINKNNTPASKGSVGKYILTGIPSIISFKGTDIGVKNTTANNTLSIETKEAKTNKRITGKNAK